METLRTLLLIQSSLHAQLNHQMELGGKTKWTRAVIILASLLVLAKLLGAEIGVIDVKTNKYEWWFNFSSLRKECVVLFASEMIRIAPAFDQFERIEEQRHAEKTDSWGGRPNLAIIPNNWPVNHKRSREINYNLILILTLVQWEYKFDLPLILSIKITSMQPEKSVKQIST